MRLDHFIAKRGQMSERSACERIAAGATQINGRIVRDRSFEVTKFDSAQLGDAILQESMERLYLRFHKPVGVVSATKDAEHTTVVDLIDHPLKDTLHLAGRLDRSSSGLILLTNDSRWSEALTSPETKVPKVYLVETLDPISESAIEQFAVGFHLQPENVVTRPAQLEILGTRSARITLHEGKWHQIKRMFHRLDENRLVSLHRVSIGDYGLGDLAPGEWAPI